MSLNQIDGSRQIKDKTLNTFTKIKGEAFTLKAGQPVKFSGASNCVLAQADSLSNTTCGLVYEDTATGVSTRIIMLGMIKVADWTTPSGGSATLTVGSEYWLSQGAAGVLTTTPPDSTGQICQYVGLATSTTEFYIQIEQPMVV